MAALTMPQRDYSHRRRHGAEGSGVDAQWNLLMAASVLFVLQPMAIFFLGQRVFVHGDIRATGLKG
jgi:ABC-type glycerol-3-phosphate transport system permease component